MSWRKRAKRRHTFKPPETLDKHTSRTISIPNHILCHNFVSIQTMKIARRTRVTHGPPPPKKNPYPRSVTVRDFDVDACAVKIDFAVDAMTACVCDVSWEVAFAEPVACTVSRELRAELWSRVVY